MSPSISTPNITRTPLPFVFDDGGREAAGYRGRAGDCVARSIAIATGLPYADVYAALANGNACERRTRRTGRSSGKRSARAGIRTSRKWFTDYMTGLGWTWIPTMGVGTGCKVHMAAGELPMGRIIVKVSKHYSTVIDGVIHDAFDPSRNGTRCVYGYWRKAT